MIKYADDTVIVGLIDRNCEKEDTSTYFWRDNNFLNLNVKKTKYELNPVFIDSENVETVQKYKYLSFIVDNKLKDNAHVNRIYKNANQRLFFL